MYDSSVVIHPTQSGQVRIVVSTDGPTEAIITTSEARELVRRLLWAARLADAVRMRGPDDEIGVGLTDPGGDET